LSSIAYSNGRQIFVRMAPSSLSMCICSRNFVYTFQVVDDAVQTEVHKALYPFYTKTKLLHFTAIGTKNALRWQQ